MAHTMTRELSCGVTVSWLDLWLGLSEWSTFNVSQCTGWKLLLQTVGLGEGTHIGAKCGMQRAPNEMAQTKRAHIRPGMRKKGGIFACRESVIWPGARKVWVWVWNIRKQRFTVFSGWQWDFSYLSQPYTMSQVCTTLANTWPVHPYEMSKSMPITNDMCRHQQQM